MVLLLCAVLTLVTAVASADTAPLEGDVQFIDMTRSVIGDSVTLHRLAGVDILHALEAMSSEQDFSAVRYIKGIDDPDAREFGSVCQLVPLSTKTKNKFSTRWFDGKNSANHKVQQKRDALPPHLCFSSMRSPVPNTIVVYVNDDPKYLATVEECSPHLHPEVQFQFRAVRLNPPSIAVLETDLDNYKGIVFSEKRDWKEIEIPDSLFVTYSDSSFKPFPLKLRTLTNTKDHERTLGAFSAAYDFILTPACVREFRFTQKQARRFKSLQVGFENQVLPSIQSRVDWVDDYVVDLRRYYKVGFIFERKFIDRINKRILKDLATLLKTPEQQQRFRQMFTLHLIAEKDWDALMRLHKPDITQAEYLQFEEAIQSRVSTQVSSLANRNAVQRTRRERGLAEALHKLLGYRPGRIR